MSSAPTTAPIIAMGRISKKTTGINRTTTSSTAMATPGHRRSGLREVGSVAWAVVIVVFVFSERSMTCAARYG